MQIYNQFTPSFILFSPLDFKQVLSENAQKYAKIAAVALAIFAAAAAVYYLVKWMNAINLDVDPDLENEHEKKVIDREDLVIEEVIDDYDDVQAIKNKDAAERAKRAADAAKRAMEIEAEKKYIAQQADIIPAPQVNEEVEWMILYQLVEEEEEAQERAKELEKQRVRLAKLRPPPPPPAPPPIKNPIGNAPAGDSLQGYTVELAGYINEIVKTLPANDKKRSQLNSLSNFLITNKHKNEINNYCDSMSKPEYKDSLYQSYTGSFKTVCDFFKNKEFPLDKKMEVLERLEKERNICVPGRVSLLNEICNSMDEPVDIAKRLSWLIACYKIEVLKEVNKDTHALNIVICRHGIEFGLPDSVISTAKTDLHMPHFKYAVPQNYLSAFRSSCTPKGCIDFLENYINSDLPGRGAYRTYILGVLADQVTDEQVDDEKVQAFIKATHEKALKNEEKLEKESHLKKFGDNHDSPEAEAEWEKILKKINLKKDPYIDATLYANYHYRLNPEDSEDDKLTRKAIELFADDAVKELHKPHQAAH